MSQICVRFYDIFIHPIISVSWKLPMMMWYKSCKTCRRVLVIRLWRHFFQNLPTCRYQFQPDTGFDQDIGWLTHCFKPRGSLAVEFTWPSKDKMIWNGSSECLLLLTESHINLGLDLWREMPPPWVNEVTQSRCAFQQGLGDSFFAEPQGFKVESKAEVEASLHLSLR